LSVSLRLSLLSGNQWCRSVSRNSLTDMYVSRICSCHYIPDQEWTVLERKLPSGEQKQWTAKRPHIDGRIPSPLILHKPDTNQSSGDLSVIP
jgi:hypothetical protein